MDRWKHQILHYLSRAGFLAFVLGYFLLFVIKHTLVGRLVTFLFIPLAVLFYAFFRPLPEDVMARQERAIVQIPAGASFQQIADSLIASETLEHKTWFLVLGKLSGKEKKMRAGLFEVPKGLSTWSVLGYLETAPSYRIKVTLPEGIVSSQMAVILEKRIGINAERFSALVNDSLFASSLVPGIYSLEGFLLPETYFFEWKTPEKQIIQHMVANTLKIFEADSVQAQLQLLKRSMLEIVTLASIVEGEALVDSERAVIASLYHNRLRLGWPLQADPTIQFVVPGPPRRLLYKDLEIDSPYNTYKYAGLPPGPINNPGQKSLLATLFPATTSYLYMVAVGDGSHQFSKTLREHNRGHAKFNEVRQQLRREQRQKQAAGK